MTILLIIAAWITLGAILFHSWIRFNKGLKTQEQIMDEAVNMNFEFIECVKSISFDSHVRCNRKGTDHLITLVWKEAPLEDITKDLHISEAAEVAYVHANFDKIWNEVQKL